MAKTEKRSTIGALWKQKTKKGDVYFTGRLNDTDIVIFKNGFQKEQKEGAPDYLMYESVPMEGQGKTVSKKPQNTEDDF